MRRRSRAAGCWRQGVSTPQGGAQHPQRHHEARKGKGPNRYFFPVFPRDPTICHEKALKFYDFFVNKLSFEALRYILFKAICLRVADFVPYISEIYPYICVFDTVVYIYSCTVLYKQMYKAQSNSQLPLRYLKMFG